MSGNTTKPKKFITINNIRYIIVDNIRRNLRKLSNGIEYFIGEDGRKEYPCQHAKCDKVRTRKPRRTDGFCSTNCAEAANGRVCPRCGITHYELINYCSLRCANTRNHSEETRQRQREKALEVKQAIDDMGQINFLQAMKGSARDPLDPTRVADPNRPVWHHKYEDDHIIVDTRFWNTDESVYVDENGVVWHLMGREPDYWDKV